MYISGMEGFPLALVAENIPMLELLVGGNLDARATRALCRQFLVNEQICEQSLLKWPLKVRRNTPAFGQQS